MEELDLLLASEIESRKRHIENVMEKDDQEERVHGETKFFVKRREWEKVHRKQYLEEHKQMETQREERRHQKLQELDKFRQKSAPSKEASRLLASNFKETLIQSALEGHTSLPVISSGEVIRRLRARHQPIRLFGETDERRIHRLRTIESIENDAEGQRNDFMRTVAQLDATLDLEALKRKSNALNADNADHDDTTGDGGQVKPDKAKEEKAKFDHVVLNVPISVKMLLGDRSFLCRLIKHYLKRLISEWKEDLDARPELVKRGTQGKLATATQRQTDDYIQPLFSMLTDRTIPEDILQHVTTICELMQQREYVKASDCYYLLSIGNAPWPIGVTMVGIHERSAREKISSKQVAHVLNDERQRKWIQSLKRLMTFSQKRYPPEDLSKCV